ncbi:MAG TPA: hypothetical protein PK941_10300 [Paludibacter sp.]|nr:hypothetical protein [Paludibacter sp.]
MKTDDTHITAKLFTAADFQTYLKHGWTLLDIKSGGDAYPVIYLMGKKKTATPEGKKDD